MVRARDITLGAVVPASAATAVLAVWRHEDLATFRPPLRVGVETAATLVALLAAYLVAGRLRRTVSLNDVLLVGAFYVLALSNFAFGAIPAVFERGTNEFAAWAVTLGQTAGAAVLAAAALLPVHRVTPRAGVDAHRFVLGSALVIVAAIAAVATLLPDPVRPAPLGFETASATAFVYALAGGLSFGASVGFVHRAEERGDELLAWFAAGVGLAAVARVCYLVFPAPYGGWVQPGDAFRVLFYAAVLVGAAREINRYWRGLAERAVLEERRRIARDLHDGVAQELAFIVRRSRRLADDVGGVQQIAAAAERALDDSRRAIAALTRPVDEPLDVVIREAVEEVAGRLGRSVDVAIAPGVEVTPQVRDALVRIACEAVANAARHADAHRIDVELVAAPRPTLRIVDDGRGFDGADVRVNAAGGFGLTSMRERAEAMGAEFSVRSEPSRGTTVEVALR